MLKGSNIKLEFNNIGSHKKHWNAVFGVNNKDEKQDIKIILFDCKQLFADSRTYQIIPVQLKTVIELTHLNRKNSITEAVVLGSGKDEFMVDFFAIDYMENSYLYKKDASYNIALSGLSYKIDKIDEEERDDLFQSDMCMYLPSQDKKFDSAFDFIGKILLIEELEFKDEKLFIYTIQLISHLDDANIFNLPILINQTNMRNSKISIGDMVSSSFWMYGRIVE